MYGAVSIEQGIAATEVMGFVLHNATATVPGMAGSVRLGGRYGLAAPVSGMSRPDGWNSQVLAQGVVWPLPWAAFSAGARITRDPAETSVSLVGGATLRHAGAELNMQAHAGTERLAFSMGAPTVMSFASATDAGVTFTASYGLSRQVVLCGQAQIERLPPSVDTNAGTYLGVAAGLVWYPNRVKEAK